MGNHRGTRRANRFFWVLPALLVVGAWTILGAGVKWLGDGNAFRATLPGSAGPARLLSVQPLPETEGAQCVWMPASAPTTLLAALRQRESATPASPESTREEAAKRQPLWKIQDPYPSLSSVAVDVKHDEVVMTDENLFQVLVYDRRANTPPTASFTEPKRIIAGEKTKIEFQCGLYIDPANGDIYAVNNDTVDTLVIFNREVKGDMPPTRELRTPHGTFGIAVDEGRQELFLTIQHSSAVVVYHKMAQDQDRPLRILQGNSTRLADPHGIALDTKNGLLFVTNHGSIREFQTGGSGESGSRTYAGEGASAMPSRRTIPGSGRLVPSSISVYPIDAQGDTAPLRVITGPRTQLNWPTGLAMDPERGELYVANDMGNSVLVFSLEANGDVAPKRVLQGPKTGMKNPTGINLDLKNQEMWVANFGNHTATVYPMSASGDTAPLRTIRSGPVDEPALMIGNPGSVAYDSKREEILVPN